MKNYTHKYISKNGDVFYYDERWRFHRIDGPAIKRVDGSKSWCVNGKRHRIDGPAYIGSRGFKEYWINDKPILKSIFEKLQKMRKVFNDDYLLEFLLLEGRIIL